MKKRLLLYISDIEDTNWPIEAMSRNIVNELTKTNHIRVKSGHNLMKRLLERITRGGETYATPNKSTYEIAIGVVLERHLGVGFKKWLLSEHHKVEWLDSEKAAEFFYKDSFKEVLKGHPEVYLSHPYIENIMGNYSPQSRGIETVQTAMYVEIMPDILTEINPYWVNQADENTSGMRVLETTLRRAIARASWDFLDNVREKIEYR